MADPDSTITDLVSRMLLKLGKAYDCRINYNTNFIDNLPTAVCVCVCVCVCSSRSGQGNSVTFD